MQFIIISVTLTVSAVAVAVPTKRNANSETAIASHWEQFKSKYGKKYETLEDEARHRKNWEENLELIAKHNADFDNGLESYSLAINKFGDLKKYNYGPYANYGPDDMQMTAYSQHNLQLRTFRNSSNVQIPPFVDWRQHNRVTSVRDQLNCGSCWAFSVVGALEGQYAASTGELRIFSAQQLVDCDLRSNGCGGGRIESAYEYMKENRMASELLYPYQAQRQRCRYDDTEGFGIISGYVKVEQNEAALTEAIANVGPISIGIAAQSPKFLFYNDGVYYDEACNEQTWLNHAVLAVGYGEEEIGGVSREYYLVKNEWGTEWGEDGYFKIARNRNNHCGIAHRASYPYL